MIVALVIGVLVGVLVATWEGWRVATGRNQRVRRNFDGSVMFFWQSTIGVGVLWGGIVFLVVWGITSVV